MRNVSDQPLKVAHRSAILEEQQTGARDQIFDKLIRRLNKLEPGRRYMLTIDITGKVAYTILDIGKIEG